MTSKKGWLSEDAHSEFIASPTYNKFVSGLSVFRHPDIDTVRSDHCVWLYHLRLQAYTALAKVFIPAPATEEQRQKIEAFQGQEHELLPSSKAMRKFMATNPCCRSSSKGWFDGVVMKNGQLMNVVLWVHVFVSPEEEKDFKANVLRSHPKSRSDSSESVDMVTYFDLMLKDAGAVHWEEEHCVEVYGAIYPPRQCTKWIEEWLQC